MTGPTYVGLAVVCCSAVEHNVPQPQRRVVLESERESTFFAAGRRAMVQPSRISHREGLPVYPCRHWLG